MKRFIAVVLAVVFCMCLFGCERAVDTSYGVTTNLKPVSIGDNLYYDVQTKVVYMMFGHKGNSYQGYGYMSAYYAPNGLPYIYDANSQTLVEIEPDQ